MKRVISLFGLAAAVGVLPVVAQAPGDGVVKGVVVARQSQLPVQAALVRVVGGHVQELTHADGTFHFPRVPSGSVRLLITAIGYKATTLTVTVDADQTATVRAQLEESVVQLDELVTTGTVGATTRSEALSPTSVVSGAALDRQLDATIAGSLRHEPGVAVGGIGPATAQPVIRGLGGDRVVILQDGLRPGDLASVSADHAISVDPLTAKRIEVVRGPMSLLYGSSALGGVVNVIREEIPAAVSDAVHGMVSAQATGVNRGGAAGGYVTGGGGPLAWRFEGTLRANGDTRTPIGRLANTEVTTVDVAGATSYIGRSGHAGLSYRLFDSNYGLPGDPGEGEAGADVTMRRHAIRANGEFHPRSDRWETVTAQMGFTSYRHQELEPDGEVATDFDQTLFNANVVARHTGWLGARSGAVGFNGTARSIETGGELMTPSTSDVGLAAFVVQEFASGPIRLQAGFRADLSHYSPAEGGVVDVGGRLVPVRARTFASWSGSLGALYDVGSGVRVGASVARAYRTPDFNELYTNGPHLASNSFDVGDPSLDPERGLGFDAFVRIERTRARIEVAAFRNHLANYIFPSSRGQAITGPDGGPPVFQYTNESARFGGLEGLISLSVTPRLAVEATGSYVGARFTNDRAPIPVIGETDTTFVAASKRPPFIPPFFGTVEARYERPRAFFGAGIRWAARQGRVGDFETPTDGYVVGDVHAGVRLLLGGQFHTFTLRVDNLTNAEYRDHLSRIKAFTPQPGRNVSLLYRVAF